VFSYLTGRVTEGGAAHWITSAKPGKFAEGRQTFQFLERQMHDMGEGEVRAPVDHRSHSHRHVFTDIAEGMLARRTYGLYVRGLQTI
jgi:hypothetical protein